MYKRQTFGTAVVFNSGGSSYISVTSIDSTHVVVAYRDDGNSDFGTAIVGTISSGDTIAFGTEVVFNSRDSYYISVTSIDSTHVVVAYRDDGNSSFGTGIVIEVTGGYTYSKIVGVIQENTTTGNDVKLTVDGIVDGFTGLTPLTDYYIDKDGTLTTDSEDTKIGRALSPTQIFLDSTDFTFQGM